MKIKHKSSAIISKPISNAYPKFSFPKFKIITDNNFKLIFNPVKSSNLITLKISFKTGTSEELKHGLAYLTCSMLSRGTGTMTSTEISEQIDSLGATLNFNVSHDDFNVHLIVLEENLSKILDILSDCLFESVFNETEFNTMKSRIKALIMQDNADINYLATQAFNKALYLSHPYSGAILGDLKTIDNISEKECIDWHYNYVMKSSVSITVGCSLKYFKIIEDFSKKFRNNSKIRKSILTSPKQLIYNRGTYIHKNDSSQVSLKLGKFVLNRHNEDFPKLQLLNTIYGGYFLSRLNTILREEKGYTYGIHSYIDSRVHSSSMIIATNINKNQTADSVRIILDEMSKIAMFDISIDELNTVKQYILGSFLRSIETDMQVTSMLYSMDLLGLDINYYNNFFHTIKNINIPDLEETRINNFKPEKIAISGAGDENILSEQLAGFCKLKKVIV